MKHIIDFLGKPNLSAPHITGWYDGEETGFVLWPQILERGNAAIGMMLTHDEARALAPVLMLRSMGRWAERFRLLMRCSDMLADGKTARIYRDELGYSLVVEEVDQYYGSYSYGISPDKVCFLAPILLVWAMGRWFQQEDNTVRAACEWLLAAHMCSYADLQIVETCADPDENYALRSSGGFAPIYDKEAVIIAPILMLRSMGRWACGQ